MCTVLKANIISAQSDVSGNIKVVSGLAVLNPTGSRWKDAKIWDKEPLCIALVKIQ